jgi:spore maturation protein CgeB
LTKILLVHPGASYSTHDVFVGLFRALETAGVEVSDYALDVRIGWAKTWLEGVWRKRGRIPEEKPTWWDIMYWACRDARDMAEIRRVDWVLVISAMYLHPDALLSMRRAGLRVAALFTESPYDDDKQARVAELVDVCWTNERASVRGLQQSNPNTSYLRAAYDPARHMPLAEAEPDVPAHDVVFVGTGFPERVELLAAVDWSGIDLGLYGMWDRARMPHRLRPFVRGKVVSNEQAAALYRQAKIGLNLYRRPPQGSKAESMNPRAYELAACGVFQVSDRRAEGVETLAQSVPTFRTADDLSDVVRHYLTNEKARRAMSVSARRLIEPHTFAARAAHILGDLEQFEAQPIAKGA